MAKLYDAVQRFRKVEEVCSVKDDLPPVYLMDEIVELSKESADNAQSVAEHVTRNLVNKNPVVKWKALKLTKHLCVKGCSQFQRAMQRSAQSVRDLIHYKGEPDPFKGDANNQRVRDLAKEVVELLYAHVPQAASSVAPMAAQGRIQGFGSTAGPGPAYGSATGGSGGGGGGGQTFSSGSRMMAFGSSNAPPPGSSSLSSASRDAYGGGGGGGGGGGARGGGGFMGNSQTTTGGSHSRNGSLGEPVLAAHNRSSTPTSQSTGSFGPPGYTSAPSHAHGGSNLNPNRGSSNSGSAAQMIQLE